MSNTSKYMIFGSVGASALVALAAMLDVVTKTPFGGQTAMDVMFVLGAAIVIYMGWDAYQDSK